MSEELIKSLNQRINELQARNTQLEVARKEAKREAAALRGELETARQEHAAKVAEMESEWEAAEEEYSALVAERDEFRSRAEAPPDERITQLEQEIRTRDLKAKFRDVEAQLAEGFDLDAAWKIQGFDPAKVEDLAKFDATELAKEWRASRPGLFKPEGTGSTPAQGTQRKQPLKVATELPSRGARDSMTGRTTYRASDIATPGWYVRNPALHEAMQNGTADLIDD